MRIVREDRDEERWLMSVRLVLRVIIYSWVLACPAIASSPQHYHTEELGFQPTVFEGIPIQSWMQRDSTACTKGTAHVCRAGDTVEFSAVEMNHPNRLSKSKSWLIESGDPDFPSLSCRQVFFLQPSCWKIWTWDSTVWICLLLQWAGRPPPARLLFV